MRDAFLCEGVRTAIGRYGGALAGVRPDDLAAHVIREVMLRAPNLDATDVDDTILGCANQAGEDNRNVARMAALLAGLPVEVPGVTLNRLCGSGLDAVASAGRAIRCGEADVILAGGVESMSRAPFVLPKAEVGFSRSNEIHDTTMGWRFVNEVMRDRFGADSMPETAENVAEEFSISRTDQDAFALRSQERTAAAKASGRLAEEIVGISISRRKGEPRIIDEDENPRPTTAEKLGLLRTPFRNGGTVTAGNASGINDGAAVMIVASGAAVEKFDLTPQARIVGAATAGVAPRVMGIGPVPATNKLLEWLNLSVADMDVVELNEAFAAQALAVLRLLNLPDDGEHVNPNGGAIALGHPLGMSGARLALTAAMELKKRDAKLALCTMCIGVGQGIAMVLEAV